MAFHGSTLGAASCADALALANKIEHAIPKEAKCWFINIERLEKRRHKANKNALTVLPLRVIHATVTSHQALDMTLVATPVLVLATVNNTLAQRPCPLSPGDNCRLAPKSSA